MPVDSRDKRASVLGVNSSAPRLEQNASGLIGQTGRQFAALVYIGILAAGAIIPPPPPPPVVVPPVVVVAPPPAPVTPEPAKRDISIPWGYGHVPKWRVRPSGRVIDGAVDLRASPATIRASGTVLAPPARPVAAVAVPVAVPERRSGAVSLLAVVTYLHARGTVIHRRQADRTRQRQDDDDLALKLLGWDTDG